MVLFFNTQCLIACANNPKAHTFAHLVVAQRNELVILCIAKQQLMWFFSSVHNQISCGMDMHAKGHLLAVFVSLYREEHVSRFWTF